MTVDVACTNCQYPVLQEPDYALEGGRRRLAHVDLATCIQNLRCQLDNLTTRVQQVEEQ